MSSQNRLTIYPQLLGAQKDALFKFNEVGSLNMLDLGPPKKVQFKTQAKREQLNSQKKLPVFESQLEKDLFIIKNNDLGQYRKKNRMLVKQAGTINSKKTLVSISACHGLDHIVKKKALPHNMNSMPLKRGSESSNSLCFNKKIESIHRFVTTNESFPSTVKLRRDTQSSQPLQIHPENSRVNHLDQYLNSIFNSSKLEQVLNDRSQSANLQFFKRQKQKSQLKRQKSPVPKKGSISRVTLQSALNKRKSDAKLIESDESVERPVKTGKMLIQSLIHDSDQDYATNGRSMTQLAKPQLKPDLQSRKEASSVIQRPRSSAIMNNNLVEIYHLQNHFQGNSQIKSQLLRDKLTNLKRATTALKASKNSRKSSSPKRLNSSSQIVLKYELGCLTTNLPCQKYYKSELTNEDLQVEAKEAYSSTNGVNDQPAKAASKVSISTDKANPTVISSMSHYIGAKTAIEDSTQKIISRSQRAVIKSPFRRQNQEEDANKKSDQSLIRSKGKHFSRASQDLPRNVSILTNEIPVSIQNPFIAMPDHAFKSTNLEISEKEIEKVQTIHQHQSSINQSVIRSSDQPRESINSSLKSQDYHQLLAVPTEQRKKSKKSKISSIAEVRGNYQESESMIDRKSITFDLYESMEQKRAEASGHGNSTFRGPLITYQEKTSQPIDTSESSDDDKIVIRQSTHEPMGVKKKMTVGSHQQSQDFRAIQQNWQINRAETNDFVQQIYFPLVDPKAGIDERLSHQGEIRSQSTGAFVSGQGKDRTQTAKSSHQKSSHETGRLSLHQIFRNEQLLIAEEQMMAMGDYHQKTLSGFSQPSDLNKQYGDYSLLNQVQLISGGQEIYPQQKVPLDEGNKVQILDSFVGESNQYEFIQAKSHERVTSAELSEFDHDFKIQSLKEYKKMIKQIDAQRPCSSIQNAKLQSVSKDPLKHYLQNSLLPAATFSEQIHPFQASFKHPSNQQSIQQSRIQQPSFQQSPMHPPLQSIPQSNTTNFQSKLRPKSSFSTTKPPNTSLRSCMNVSLRPLGIPDQTSLDHLKHQNERVLEYMKKMKVVKDLYSKNDKKKGKVRKQSTRAGLIKQPTGIINDERQFLQQLGKKEEKANKEEGANDTVKKEKREKDIKETGAGAYESKKESIKAKDEVKQEQIQNRDRKRAFSLVVAELDKKEKLEMSWKRLCSSLDNFIGLGKARQQKEIHRVWFGAFQILKPSYEHPMSKYKSVTLNPNVLVMHAPLHDKSKPAWMFQRSKDIVVESSAVLDCPYIPKCYTPIVVMRKMVKKVIVGVRSVGLRLPLIPSFIQDKIFKNTEDDDVESIGSLEDGMDKNKVKHLIGNRKLHVEFSYPIKFQVKQHLRLITKIKSHSNKLKDLSEFRKQKVDIYISTNEDEEPGPLNFVLHKVINFDLNKTGYDKEYEINPKYSFWFKPKMTSIHSDKIYIRIIGQKACEIELIAQLSLTEDSATQDQLTEPQTAQQKAEAIESINADLNKFLTSNTVQNVQTDDFVQKNIETMTDLVPEIYKTQKNQKQESAGLTRALRIHHAKKFKENQIKLIHQQFLESQGRWDNYREARTVEQIRAMNIIWQMARIRIWLTLLNEKKVIQGLTRNFELWKSYNREQIAKMRIFLKIFMWRIRFHRRYGSKYKHRQLQYTRRILTFGAHVQQLSGKHEQKASELIARFLNRTMHQKMAIKCVIEVVKRSKRIFQQIKGQLGKSLIRFKGVKAQLLNEIDYLIWLYKKSEKIYNMGKRQAKKDRSEGGTSMPITGKEMAAITQQLINLRIDLDDESSNATVLVKQTIRTLIRRIEMEYCLDFLIWRFMRNNLQIQENEDAKINYYMKKKNHELLLQQQFFLIKRFKELSTKIYGTEETIYDATDVVDMHLLFQIDPEYEYESEKLRNASNDNQHTIPSNKKLIKKISSPIRSKQLKRQMTKSNLMKALKVQLVETAKPELVYEKTESTCFQKFEFQQKARI